MRVLIVAPCLALLAIASSAIAAPDEELLGKSDGYPVGNLTNWFFDERVRVGSFSHLDEILPHHSLAKAATPLEISRAGAPAAISYRLDEQTYSLDDFLDHQRVTGFLLIKDGKILAERYQYDRTERDRFISHSMGS